MFKESFLSFHSALFGWDFYKVIHGEPIKIYRYQLWYMGFTSEELLKGKTRFIKTKSKRSIDYEKSLE